MKRVEAILFEPWNLGDAVIALAIALQDPTRLSLACNSKWQDLISSAALGLHMPKLISVDLGYISRNKASPLHFGNLSAECDDVPVLSIRGDLRDYVAAKKIFPRSAIRVNGWISFMARRTAIFDFPYANEWLPVRNRYKAWASIANVEWSNIMEFYQQKRSMPHVRSIAVHVGAQWRSKQFPNVAKLVESLTGTSHVQIIAGPEDPLPEGINETDVHRLANGDLVNALRSCSHVIANDSGPMHLAALLGCRTMVIARDVAIREWLPPTAVAVESIHSPKGYRPNPDYLSDDVSGGWPSVSDIMERLESELGE